MQEKVVVGSLSAQGTYLGFRFDSQSGCMCSHSASVFSFSRVSNWRRGGGSCDGWDLTV